MTVSIQIISNLLFTNLFTVQRYTDRDIASNVKWTTERVQTFHTSQAEIVFAIKKDVPYV
jgi:hypothetical protein